MQILVIADIHGYTKVLDKILNQPNLKFDLIICPGNITNSFNIPPELAQTDIAMLVIQKLFATGKQLLTVPGNHDTPEIIDLLEEYRVNLHLKRATIGDKVFVGFGGAETPFNTPFEPTEDEIKEGLERLTKGLNDFILVVHNPPKGTKLDRLISGEHVGSAAVRQIIETKQPSLVLTAHIHEGAGVDRLGRTILFNPGPAFEGFYGIVTIDKRDIRCEQKRAE